MRKVVMMNRISVDGYFASLNEAAAGMDWFLPDPEVDVALHEVGHGDTLILGATTFDVFEKGWVPILQNPDAPPPLKAIAEELTGMTKLVFSTTRKASTWANTKFYDGSLAAVVRELKAGEGADVLIFGSGTIVRQLANEGLIDEYVFVVTPVVVGEGKPLFAQVGRLGLTLLRSKAFASGNVLLHYEARKQ